MLRPLTGLAQDARSALRAWRRSPALVLVALVTFALGIGATTTLFSVVHGLILSPLPFADPGRLVWLSESNPEEGIEGWELSFPLFLDVEGRSRLLADAAAFVPHRARSRHGGEAVWVEGAAVTPGLFDLLGVPPALGRVPEAGEGGVVVVSHAFWRERLGATPSVVGEPLPLDGRPYTVIGVMPEGFAFPSVDTQAWLPLGPPQDWMQNRAVHILRVVGRLAEGAAADDATRELAGLYAQGQEADPGSDPGHRVDVAPLGRVVVGEARPAVLALSPPSGSSS